MPAGDVPYDVTEDEQSKEADPETIADPEGEAEPAPTAPHLVLELDGDRQLFRCRGQKANQYLLVKYLDDLSSVGFAATRAVVKLALGQVLPDEQRRLEAYLDVHGFAEDFDSALYAALEACWKGETLLPFAPSSDS